MADFYRYVGKYMLCGVMETTSPQHIHSVLSRPIKNDVGQVYTSLTAFNAAFPHSTKAVSPQASPLKIEWLTTPLGPMLCVADETHLYMLEFTNRKSMARGFEALRKSNGRAITPGRTAITKQIKAELTAYFGGELKQFKTPLAPTGTPFQKQVWAVLRDIPYGQSCAYSDWAVKIGNQKAVRAVASANARNLLALIIPCHRVIAKDGGLGGYAGGIDKKDWLLTHEAAHS